MRVIDMRAHDIVDSGQTWPYSKKPCSKEMLPMLEQNESVVTWVAPRGSSSTTDQFPAIRIGRKYYSISLRMMKAIWRHVRLARDFVNLDVSKDGRAKLRIPVKLYTEKKRTQNRFNTMRIRPKASIPHAQGRETEQEDQPAQPASRPRESFHCSQSHCKAHRLFCEMILPVSDEAVYQHLPQRTAFVFTEEDILASALLRIDKKCPHLYRDRSRFMRAVESIVFGKEGSHPHR